MRPLLLDLYCKAGGCAVGYHRAGFDVLGVDVEPQPRFPFSFWQADALEVLQRLARGRTWHGYRLRDFAAIHASPPCQAYTVLKSTYRKRTHPSLLPQTRELLVRSGLPYVIENVPGAPIRGIRLCGGMFGLRTYRHRYFESNTFLWQPPHPKHKVRTNRKKDRRKAHWEAGGFVSVVGDIGSYVGPEAMGIDWMTGNELSQAIPPPYTEFVGRQLLRILGYEPTRKEVPVK